MVLSPGSPQLGPGASFGPYRIDRVIGVGGMGVVYLATDSRLGRRVALKTVLGHFSGSPAFVERFQREAATLARLESPHVIQIFDHGVEDDVPFIATQYAGGGDLGRLLATHGPMPPRLAAELCSQVADAMADAHRVGVIHRDVKPANVLLRDDRLDRVHVYLCDFGVALTDTDTGGLTEPGAVSGTWNYLAPERISGGPGSAASDLYAVGCLLWETLTGRPPYGGSDVEVAMGHQGEPVPQLAGNDEFSGHANRILARALAKDPAARYPSASALRDDLRSLAGLTTSDPQPLRPLTGDGGGWQPTPQTAVSASSRPASASSRRPRRVAWWVAAAVALIAIGTGAVVAVVAGNDDGEDPPGATTSTGTESTGSPSGSPTAPPPDAEEPVTGDIDGDGRGDLGVLTPGEGMRVYASDGTTLTGPTVRRHVKFLAVSADVDRDGELDVVKIVGDPPNIAVVVSGIGIRTPVQLLDNDYLSTMFDISFNLADVDGNGYPDLVLMTQVGPEDRQVDVALGDGTGAFGAPTTWYSGPVADGPLVAIDVDEDGTDDLVSVDASEGTLTFLRSDGTTFAPVGQPSELEEALSNVRAADVDGDGNDELVVVAAGGFTGLELGVVEWNGTAFEARSWFFDEDWTLTVATTRYVASDVDGDGKDDVIRVGDDPGTTRLDERIDVFLSDGTAFRRAPEWGGQQLADSPAGVLGPDLN